MFVIADLEWVTNQTGHFSPTQLAAVKVDESWHELERFSALIRPCDGTFHDWKHVAYTGGTATAFLHAKNAYSVLQSFIEWLSAEDAILWWHEESDAVFQKLVKLLIKSPFQNKTIILNKYISAFLYGDANVQKSPYQMAKAQGIDTNPALKHCAINDVMAMQKLLATIDFAQAVLQNPMESHKIEWKPTAGERKLPYQYDPATNKMHRRDCPLLLASGAKTKGFASRKTLLKKGFRLCDCCKEDYKTALREKNQRILERTSYTYVYTPTSKVFHKYTCGTMLSAKQILGAGKYNTVAKTGRRPCKLCNPSPADTHKPLPEQMKITHLEKHPRHMVAKEAAKAILRQKVALEERHRKLQDKTLTQQEIDDIYTLTQPRFAFWAGKGYQTFHLHSCPKLQGLSHLRGFSTYKAAIRAGLTPCRTCKPTAKHDIIVSLPITSHIRKHERIKDLEMLCRDAGYSYRKEGDYFYLETSVGKWRVHVGESPVKLDHINLVKTPGVTVYHEQPRIFLSFIDAFDYIKRHDGELAQRAAEGKVLVKWFEKGGA